MPQVVSHCAPITGTYVDLQQIVDAEKIIKNFQVRSTPQSVTLQFNETVNENHVEDLPRYESLPKRGEIKTKDMGHSILNLYDGNFNLIRTYNIGEIPFFFIDNENSLVENNIPNYQNRIISGKLLLINSFCFCIK